MSIPRGATRLVEFTLSGDVEWEWDELAYYRVDVLHCGKLTIKEPSECRIEGRTLLVPFSEDETLAWKADKQVEFQICVKFANGEIDKCRIVNDTAARVLNGAKME